MSEFIGEGTRDRCWTKAKWIREKLGIELGEYAHDVVSYLCNVWGCENEQEFYATATSMGIDALREAVTRARDRIRRKMMGLEEEIAPYIS